MPQLTTLRRARLGSKPLKCDLHKLSVKVREAFGLLCSASCGGIPAARRLRVFCLGEALSGSLVGMESSEPHELIFRNMETRYHTWKVRLATKCGAVLKK
jgi:hypothetical protein